MDHHQQNGNSDRQRHNEHPARVSIYNVAKDFSITQNPSDSWSYGWSTTLGGPLNLYPTTHQQYLGIWGWYDPTLGNEPNVLSNITNMPSGQDRLTWQPGQLSLHPGPNGEFGDVRWTAPSDGVAFIKGDFYGSLNTGGFLSTDVHVLQDGVPLFDGYIFGSSDVAAFNRIVAVKAGDTVDFAVGVGPDGNNISDTTGLDAKIRFLGTEDQKEIGRDGNQIFSLGDHLKSAARQGTNTDFLPRLSPKSDGTGGSTGWDRLVDYAGGAFHGNLALPDASSTATPVSLIGHG
jgi:hypothetical protein